MKRGFCFSVISAFNPILSPFQAATAKVAALRRTIINKQTKHIPESGFGVTSTDFWVGDSTEPEAKSGRSLLSQRGAGGLVGPGRGGHWRGGRVRGRRGKGTFAVQLAALCEAGTVGRYRAGEEGEREAFSSPPVSPPPCSPFLLSSLSLSVHHLSLFLSLTI